MRRALVLVLVGLSGVAAVPAAADEGPWGWPLEGPHEVVRGFDPPASRYGAGHRGVDLPATPGAAVRASAGGRVTYAGQLAGRGVVVVTHGALRTTYEPVSAAVPLGAVVSRGDVVGQVQPGHDGCRVAACLHWGLRRGDSYLDPVRLVEPGPVRLLPVETVAGGAGLRAEPGLRAAPGSAGGAAPADAAPLPEPAGEPVWSLRAAEAPLGAAAVVALVLGIGLLARPRPGPGDPASGGVAALPAPAAEQAPAPPGALLDLAAARRRRQVS